MDPFIVLFFWQPQGDHSNCYSESFCRLPNYAPSKVPLTDPKVIEVYENALRETTIFRHAEHYCRVSLHTAIYYNYTTLVYHGHVLHSAVIFTGWNP